MRQTIDKIATLLLRLLLPLTALSVPLFFLPITTEFFSVNKNLLVIALGSIALLSWLIRNITRRRIHLSLAPATIPLLLLSVVYLISSFVQSPNLYMAITGRTALIVALTALYIGVTSSQKNQFIINFTFAGLIASAFIASLLSLYSYLGLSAALPAPAWLTSKTFNLVGGPIPFLTFVVPVLLMTAYLAFKSTRWQLKAVLLFATLLLTGASLNIGSQIIPSSGNQLFLLPISAGWSIAIDIFKNARTALLGSGPETFMFAFTRLKPLYLNLTPLWDSRFSSSSNELFTVLTTTGLLGAVFFVLSFTKSIRLGFKQISNKKSTSSINASLILVIGSFVAMLLLPANTVVLTLSVVALALLSLSIKLETTLIKDVSLSLSAETKQHPYEEELTETKKDGFQLLPWLLTIIVLPPLGFFWYVYGRAYAADLATFKAISVINNNASESYNQQVRSYNLAPYNPLYRINFSQTSLALANVIASRKDLTDQDKNNITQLVQQAISEAKNATQLDQTNIIAWENLSSIYRQLTKFAEGATDWTIASLRQAIDLDPNNSRLHLELGGVFMELKDYDSAARLFERAIQLKSNWPNPYYNLAQVYKIKGEDAKVLQLLRQTRDLLDANSDDYKKVQSEIDELEKKVAAAAPAKTDAKQTVSPNLELVTPTPLPSISPKADLPKDSAPVLP